jgi:hypothetical protein
MLTSYQVSGFGLADDGHERGARNAMGQSRQRMGAAMRAPSCGAQLDHIYWAFYWLGMADAHAASMTGPTAYATTAMLSVLKREVQAAWQTIRKNCRL